MKDPAFLFYSSDFLTGTILMTNEQIGKYIKLLCLQHQRGHLKEEEMLKICDEKLDNEIIQKFKKDKKNLYYNERLENEIIKRTKHKEKQRENGLKGGRPKNPIKTQTKPKRKPLENENENENINVIENIYIDYFNKFYSIYPKKVKKKETEKWFIKQKPDEELFKEIMNGLKKHLKSKQWKNKQYIPYPTTWLNGERWNDEVEIEETEEERLKRLEKEIEEAKKRGEW